MFPQTRRRSFHSLYGVASSVAFAVTHFAETATCPRAPQPRHRTLAVRSSTLAAELSPTQNRTSG
jgi:hypothetical protein